MIINRWIHDFVKVIKYKDKEAFNNNKRKGEVVNEYYGIHYWKYVFFFYCSLHHH